MEEETIEELLQRELKFLDELYTNDDEEPPCGYIVEWLHAQTFNY